MYTFTPFINELTRFTLKKYLLISASFAVLTVLLTSWGATGHFKISESSSLSFNSQMQDFLSWVQFLSDHASDADIRKDTDPEEGPKHYIDIDGYPEFVANGSIAQSLQTVISTHGYAFVESNGILPWATERAFDSLRNCMQRHDFAKAKIFAADLGHYVADGHMPLHITSNYNGQLTGNDGIHSRYESSMINSNISQIIYTGSDIAEIQDVNQYIFNYVYANYQYKDSVLLADNYAKSINSNTSSSGYKQALWNKTKGFTLVLFKNASHALAELIYTAWIQAGSPNLNSNGISDPTLLSNFILNDVFPNPFSSETNITFLLKEDTRVLMQLRDESGHTVKTLINDTLNSGNHSILLNKENFASGMYYLVLNNGKYIQVKKLLIVD